MSRADKQPDVNAQGIYYPLDKDEADPVDAFVVDGKTIGGAANDRFVLFVADIRTGGDVAKGRFGYAVLMAVRLAKDPLDQVTVTDLTFNGQFTAGTACSGSLLASRAGLMAFYNFQRLIEKTPPLQ